MWVPSSKFQRCQLAKEAVISRLSRICVIISLVLLALPNAATARTKIKQLVVFSNVLGEKRPLNIVLPTGYSPSAKFPVVYALDGDLPYLRSLAEHMQAENPGLIVVGVENVDRTRDMFPNPVPEKSNRGGGGERFLRFLTSELIPFVEKRFAASGYRVLSGQSNSGFFVLYAMIHAPDSFDAYLASSPMIGWDWDMIRDGTVALFENRDSFAKVLFMNRGESDSDRATDFLPRYVSLLNAIAPEDFRWEYEVVAGSGHVPENSHERGIEFIFR